MRCWILTPLRRWIQIERQEGGLRDGARITFSLGLGPVRVRWEARHYGYVDGTQFCDEQVRGPFRVWRHCHRVVPVGVGHSFTWIASNTPCPAGRWPRHGPSAAPSVVHVAAPNTCGGPSSRPPAKATRGAALDPPGLRDAS